MSTGMCSSWSNDPTLACLTIGHARSSGLDRIYSPRRSLDDWREWIYLTIMDQLYDLSIDYFFMLIS